MKDSRTMSVRGKIVKAGVGIIILYWVVGIVGTVQWTNMASQAECWADNTKNVKRNKLSS